MKMKKTLAALLATVIILSALVGCTKGTQIGGNTNELSIFMHFFGYCVYDESWPIFQKAAELTGIKLKGVASETISDSAQAYNSMLVSSTLPDIIHYNRNDLERLAVDGGLIELNDLIDEHGPNIKKYFKEYPEAKGLCSVDDKIFYITGSNAGLENGMPAVQKGWFIRTDWLEKLGLEVPKTLDDFYKAMVAFKTQDPNGNGIADEVPLFQRQEGILSHLQLFDAYNGWYETQDGKVVHGKTEENYKIAMKELQKWYKEGLIDQEIFTRGQQSREQLLGQNLGGCTNDWFSSTSAFNDKYVDTIPGFEFLPVDPPADINGVVKEVSTRSSFLSLSWGISRDCKDPVAAIKYLDFWLSDEGRELISYGIDGVHYNKVNGEYVFTDQVLNAAEGVPNYLRNQGQVEIGSIIAIKSEMMGMNAIGREGFQNYIDKGYAVPKLDTEMTTEESIEAGKIMTNIDTYMKEMQQKWIMGEADVDATWDEYIKIINGFDFKKVEDIYVTANKRAKENTQ